MNSPTQIANYALGLIGDSQISDIDDPGSKPARVCKQFLQATIDEVLRLHRWNCAIKRATLARLADAPNHGYRHAYALPTDSLRLLEVNGEPWNGSEEFFEIEGKAIVIDATECKIRYVRRIGVADFDPLLAKAVAISLAMTICVPLTANLQLQQTIAAQMVRAIATARQVDAIEVGNREGRPMRRLLDNSPLIQSRFSGYSLRRLINKFPSW